MKKRSERIKENICNVPNFFTALRVLITIVIIYLVFNDYSLKTIIILFLIGAITDAIDGNIARIFKMKTNFGAKFDMAADRFLFIGTALAFIIHYSLIGIFGFEEILQIILIFSREIFALPFVIVGYFKERIFPKVRIIGKMTTVLQAITFPTILLKFSFVWSAVFVTCAVGLISGIVYARDFWKK